MPRNFCHVLLLLLLICLVSTKAGKQIEGIFSKRLIDPGYYLVTSIPVGARSINVTELSRTVNFLAIKLQNGSYLFNEDYNIASSGKYKGAGTTFIYIRRNNYSQETFYAAGPLDSPVDVMLIYQHYEPKIFYQYELPDDYTLTSSTPDKETVTKSVELEGSSTTNFVSTISENVMMRDETRSSTVMPKRRRKRRFMWTSPGFTNCSKPCGGGFQSKRYICIIQRTQKHVPNKKCESLDKPKAITVRCNNSPCAPQWEGGPWSKCSVTCGNGTRSRELNCIKQMPENLQIRVQDHFCESQSSDGISLQEACHMPDCDIYTTVRPNLTTKQQKVSASHWKAQEWSPCSVTCGNGTRTRAVTCVTPGKPCNMKDKPATEELCNMGICKIKSITDNEIPEALTYTSWMYSAWPEQCSAECGTGTITRRLYCENITKNGTCDEDKMPAFNKNCVSNQICGQWFTGPWTKCSSSCDVGIETREVTCVSKFLGVLKVMQPSNCPGNPPEVTRACNNPPCNATWFMSDWTHCSRNCGRGVQKREVRCIGPDGNPMNATETECDEENKPVSRRHCNDFSCKSDAKDTENENDVVLINECRDIYLDCWKIRRVSQESKHKCQAEFYKKGCCKACRYSSFLRSKKV